MIWVERILTGLLALTVLGLALEASQGGKVSGLMAAWMRLADTPAVFASSWLALTVGLLACWLSLIAASALTRWLVDRPSAQPLLSVILALPHAALALGLLLFFDAGGVAVRWAMALGLIDAPPDYLFPRDSLGLGTLIILLIKETAFFTLMALPLARQLPRQSIQTMGAQCGWSRASTWQRLAWPQILMKLKPAVLIVVVFGVTNLEVALVLGPDQPQFIAVRLAALLSDADPLARAASALGLLLLLIVTAGLWGLIGVLLKRPRFWMVPIMPRKGALLVTLAPLILSVVALVIWSLALRYPMTAAWPIWQVPAGYQWHALVRLVGQTAWLGGVVSLLSVASAILVLERLMRHSKPHVTWVWWALLWLPQLPLTAGLLYLWVVLGFSPNWWAVVLGHWLIATPYALITLSEAWFDRDRRLDSLARQCGLSAGAALWHLWIPRHAGSIAVALAVSFSVSVALYTQTWLLGGGRVETLALELVSFATADRRAAALSGLAMTLLPLTVFAMALAFVANRGRNRLGLRGGGYAQVY